MVNSKLDVKDNFCRSIITGSTVNSGKESGVSLNIRLTPRSSKNEVVGLHNGALKIKVKSPPVEGAANSCLIAFLSKVLKRPKTSIIILSGHRSKEKRLKIDGVSVEEVKSLLLR